MHKFTCRSHAIGCAVENIAESARSLDLDVSDWAMTADPIAEGDTYLSEGIATCYCDQDDADMVWAFKWIVLGGDVLSRPNS